MADQKTSLLINRQVPEFVREEYPLFITFLEAYYEYLETKQGTQINDLTKQSKDLRYISDVDSSIDDFEEAAIRGHGIGDALHPVIQGLDVRVLIQDIVGVQIVVGKGERSLIDEESHDDLEESRCCRIIV